MFAPLCLSLVLFFNVLGPVRAGYLLAYRLRDPCLTRLVREHAPISTGTYLNRV